MITRWVVVLSVLSLRACALEIDDSIHHSITYLSVNEAPDEKRLLDHLDIESDEFITMRSKEDEVFVCQLPQDSEESMKPTTMYQGPTPADLLAPLYKDKLCSYRIDPYWTYELCHGQYLVQYHEDKQKKGAFRTEYYLGNYHQDYVSFGTKIEEHMNPPKRMIGEEERAYFSVLYSQGTTCDITGKPRTTTVLYVCDEDARTQIFSLAEVSSCTYEVVVLTNRLCKHPAYQLLQKKERNIACYNMDKTAEKPKPQALQDMQKVHENTFKREYEIKILEGEEAEEFMEQFLEQQQREPEEQPMRLAGERRTPWNSDSTMKSNQELVRHTVNNILTARECIVSGNGWWNYEFCYGKRLTQFHVEPNGDRTDILLGEFDEAVHKAWVDDNPEQRMPKKFEGKITQVSHVFVKGDICHEIKKHRSVEVKLRCKTVEGSPLMVLMDINEPSTCQYILVLESERFCEPLQYADDYGLIALETVADESSDDEPENKKT